ncbi:MAG TPA: membrane dipeptidase [Rhodothermales bacterium]
MNRRQFVKSTGHVTGAFSLAPFVNVNRYRLFASSQTQYSARAIEVVARATVMDMLCTFQDGPTTWIRDPDSFTQSDWQRFKDSGITVINTGPALSGGFEACVVFLARWNGFIATTDDWLMRVDGTRDLQLAKESGKLGVILGLQNSDHFSEPDDVDFFYSLGQRVSQLTYNHRNLIGNGCLERRDDGISDFGITIIERMNELGMAVDVSHCGDRTTLDAFELSSRPVLITHSNCRALTPDHPRCKTDEVIRRVGDTGSVFGITHARNFTTNAEPTTIEDVLNHFDLCAVSSGVITSELVVTRVWMAKTSCRPTCELEYERRTSMRGIPDMGSATG